MVMGMLGPMPSSVVFTHWLLTDSDENTPTMCFGSKLLLWVGGCVCVLVIIFCSICEFRNKVLHIYGNLIPAGLSESIAKYSLYPEGLHLPIST